jgi:hypothetical protein
MGDCFFARHVKLVMMIPEEEEEEVFVGDGAKAKMEDCCKAH